MNAQLVDSMSEFHAREGEAQTHYRCAEEGLIASICMTCGDLYRIRNAGGGSGGLSHGWCSHACAEAGTERAGLPQRLAATADRVPRMHEVRCAAGPC